MANRLASETSPYLLQHKDNPVDWHPWGEEALARAKAEDRPILLSIGYSACHWCHVMEHESFEDPETAAFMNANFVPVKVDREERPDLDAIYMESVQAMTGRGGWPMTVFCDPEQVPFYGGTYFPREPRMGMPSFMAVLHAVAEAWRDRRDEIRSAAQRARERLAAVRLEPSPEAVDRGVLDEAVRVLHGQFDPENGGFARAPKFPPASTLEFLLRRHVNAATPHALEMVERTLDGMARGGLWDVVGGGFSRYSVDPVWLVPHFEKMLYDNALLARAYLHGFQVTGTERWRQVCEQTLEWALREMWGPQGGFYSAFDADSEGEEGRFYVWTVAELRSVLEDEAEAAIRHWGATERGNFEGRNVLTVTDPGAATPEQVQRWRERLYQVRRQRVWPGLDDKRLCSWNALTIAALADAGAALGQPRYTDAARTAAEFVLRELRGPDGRLLRTYKDGRGRLNAYLEDHAFLVEALLALYEATFEPRWLSEARALADTMLERFADGESGGFFTTSAEHERLVVRRKDVEDQPIPSGNSAATFGLLRLAALTGEASYEQAAVGVFRLLHPVAARHPQAFAHLLCALDFHLSPVREVAIAGGPGVAGYQPLLGALRSAWRPGVVAAAGPPGDAAASAAVPLLQGRDLVDGQAAAYVCERFACRLPVTEPAALERELATAAERRAGPD